MTSDSLANWGPTAISGLALVISSLAWRAAHRSAKAAERSAVADEQAAYRQQTPKFTAKIEHKNDGGHQLAIRLDGPIDLDDLTVEILGGELYFAPYYQPGIPRSREDSRRQTWVYGSDGYRAGLTIGEIAKWQVVAATKHVNSDQVTLRCHAVAGRDGWRVLVAVVVPGSLRPGPRATWMK